MKTKICFKCSKRKPLDSFYRHPQMGDGHLGKCAECTRLDVCRHRRANVDRIREYDKSRYVGERKERAAARVRQYAVAFPGRKKANTAVSNAVRDGRLVRLPCEVCGRSDSHGHHDDYRKKLEVRWLCPVHHAEAHGRLKAI